MMTSLKLTQIESSTGVILTQEMLTRLKVEEVDMLYAFETAEGYLIAPCDPAIEHELKAGREFVKEYRETFKELAK